ncbi:hypothetical protein EJ06DRAFT_84240 [Trichodelitschia bisporula]|uniref:Nephrocystin 3-like N-terminal domain-containing protein n=1 Tax=Trichodelitschia bisporula TaxID=703511 RepID=A0A6G1HRD3_9PEZI|nr:hypothetical protein EJ06DRAFT_84240 [Trichodelitschia bisporula]
MASEPQEGLAYMYCQHTLKATQTGINVLGSILAQLLKQRMQFPDVEEQLCACHKKDARLGPNELKALLCKVCTSCPRTYLFIDAMDELEETVRRDILRALRTCSISVESLSVRIFLTGRQCIKTTVENYLTGGPSITVSAREDDVKQAIHSEINASDPNQMDEQLRIEIQEKVIQRANGLFLLPILQIRAVFQDQTLADRSTALESLPETLEDAFAQTLARI